MRNMLMNNTTQCQLPPTVMCKSFVFIPYGFDGFVVNRFQWWWERHSHFFTVRSRHSYTRATAPTHSQTHRDLLSSRLRSTEELAKWAGFHSFRHTQAEPSVQWFNACTKHFLKDAKHFRPIVCTIFHSFCLENRKIYQAKNLTWLERLPICVTFCQNGVEENIFRAAIHCNFSMIHGYTPNCCLSFLMNFQVFTSKLCLPSF